MRMLEIYFVGYGEAYRDVSDAEHAIIQVFLVANFGCLGFVCGQAMLVWQKILSGAGWNHQSLILARSCRVSLDACSGPLHLFLSISISSAL